MLRTGLGSFAITGLLAIGAAAVSVTEVTGSQVLDLHGRTLDPFVPDGQAHVLFFVQSDCPISNRYAPEIQNICRTYSGRGVRCTLVYEDVELGSPGSFDEVARRHLREYGYADAAAVVDRTRAIARQARATVTPQAVVVDRRGAIRYSGRIDNFYAALGRPRRQATEHDLRDALDALLAGRPIPRPQTEALGCHIVDPSSVRR